MSPRASLHESTLSPLVGRGPTEKPPPGDDLARFLRTPAWSDAPRTLQEAVVEMLGIELDPDEARPFPIRGLSAVVPLIDVGRRLELGVGVAASTRTAREMAKALVGDPAPTDPGALADLLAEVANLAMGSLKFMYERRGGALTAGLPRRGAPCDLRLLGAAYSAVHVHCWKAPRIRIFLTLGVRPSRRAVVAAANLEENMVLARELRNGAGEIILPAGTRLTETALERLRHGGLEGEVEVIAPDARPGSGPRAGASASVRG